VAIGAEDELFVDPYHSVLGYAPWYSISIGAAESAPGLREQEVLVALDAPESATEADRSPPRAAVMWETDFDHASALQRAGATFRASIARTFDDRDVVMIVAAELPGGEVLFVRRCAFDRKTTPFRERYETAEHGRAAGRTEAEYLDLLLAADPAVIDDFNAAEAGPPTTQPTPWAEQLAEERFAEDAPAEMRSSWQTQVLTIEVPRAWFEGTVTDPDRRMAEGLLFVCGLSDAGRSPCWSVERGDGASAVVGVEILYPPGSDIEVSVGPSYLREEPSRARIVLDSAQLGAPRTLVGTGDSTLEVVRDQAAG
jgi:hypothetical protein